MVGMDAQVNVEKSEERVCVCDDSLKWQALANGKVTSHSKDFEPPAAAMGGEVIGKVAALCPITPNPRQDNGDSASVTSSPLSLESPHTPGVDVINSKSNGCMMASGLADSPRTPKEGVFDPFAPGPDELLLAPACKKLLKESMRLVARRLNFDDVDDLLDVRGDTMDVCNLSEKLFLDTVYETLLEAIVKKQTEDFVAENHPTELQNLHTPPSPPRLTGIAETCLGAPTKAVARKSRNIDPGLCRKLEF